jgi:hypothetical protein
MPRWRQLSRHVTARATTPQSPAFAHKVHEHPVAADAPGPASGKQLPCLLSHVRTWPHSAVLWAVSAAAALARAGTPPPQADVGIQTRNSMNVTATNNVGVCARRAPALLARSLTRAPAFRRTSGQH